MILIEYSIEPFVINFKVVHQTEGITIRYLLLELLTEID